MGINLWAANRLRRAALVLATLVVGVAAFRATGALFISAAIIVVFGLVWGDDELLCMAPFFAGYPVLCILAWGWIGKASPNTMDSTLLRIDCGVAVAVWRWTMAHPAIETVLAVSYASLGVVMAVALCLSHRRRELFWACAIAGLVAPLFYLAFPAVGPKWIGHPAPHNCIPSIHLTWAVLLWIYANMGAARWLLGVFALLTGAATMGLGEHYAIDLAAAVPFIWACCLVARKMPSLFGQPLCRVHTALQSRP